MGLHHGGPPLLALQVIFPLGISLPHMFHDGLIEDLYDNIAQYQKACGFAG
jgi:hypothetical protein